MVKMQHAISAGIQAADIDIAFNCGMIPHHQGAISTARVELKYSKDPRNCKLAEEIIQTEPRDTTSNQTGGHALCRRFSRR